MSTLDNSYLPGADPRTPRVAFLCGLVGMILLAAAAYSFWPGSGTSEPEGSETHGIAVVSPSASAAGTAQALDPSLEIDPVGVAGDPAPATPSLEIDPVGVAGDPAPATAETASLSPADSVEQVAAEREQQSMHALAHIARSAGQGQSSPYPAFDTQKDLVIGPFVAPSAIPVEASEAKASAPIGQVAEHDEVEEVAEPKLAILADSPVTLTPDSTDIVAASLSEIASTSPPSKVAAIGAVDPSGPAPALEIEVTRTIWHPRSSQRSALIKVSGASPVRLREGDWLGSLEVGAIEPTRVVFRYDGVELRRGLGE
ncbi:MAG: hypothetical protein ABGX04_09825 [Myxococcales bacterium]|nr:hypothetical protein [Myxococcales bacterium]